MKRRTAGVLAGLALALALSTGVTLGSPNVASASVADASASVAGASAVRADGCDELANAYFYHRRLGLNHNNPARDQNYAYSEQLSTWIAEQC
jgi:hypothetical protein